jgi:hypothetical protein
MGESPSGGRFEVRYLAFLETVSHIRPQLHRYCALASGIGAWHPHMMVFAPYYENTMVGGNTFGSLLPQVSDDAGTPFTVVVIPVDDALAIRLHSKWAAR